MPASNFIQRLFCRGRRDQIEDNRISEEQIPSEQPSPFIPRRRVAATSESYSSSDSVPTYVASRSESQSQSDRVPKFSTHAGTPFPVPPPPSGSLSPLGLHSSDHNHRALTPSPPRPDHPRSRADTATSVASSWQSSISEEETSPDGNREIHHVTSFTLVAKGSYATGMLVLKKNLGPDVNPLEVHTSCPVNIEGNQDQIVEPLTVKLASSATGDVILMVQTPNARAGSSAEAAFKITVVLPTSIQNLDHITSTAPKWGVHGDESLRSVKVRGVHIKTEDAPIHLDFLNCCHGHFETTNNGITGHYETFQAYTSGCTPFLQIYVLSGCTVEGKFISKGGKCYLIADKSSIAKSQADADEVVVRVNDGSLSGNFEAKKSIKLDSMNAKICGQFQAPKVSVNNRRGKVEGEFTISEFLDIRASCSDVDVKVEELLSDSDQYPSVLVLTTTKKARVHYRTQFAGFFLVSTLDPIPSARASVTVPPNYTVTHIAEEEFRKFGQISLRRASEREGEDAESGKIRAGLIKVETSNSKAELIFS